MVDEPRRQSHPFTVINRGGGGKTWDGSPVTLPPDGSVSMTATPNGSSVFLFRNESAENNPATLALTAGGSAPDFLTVPPLSAQPSCLVQNWNGAALGITNVTPPGTQVPVLVELISPELPWPKSAELAGDAAPLPLGPGQSASGRTSPRWMQVILQAGSGALTVFAIFGGPVDRSGNNAYVIALNAAQDAGPGTGSPPPAGYYATTVGALYTYQLNWGAAPILIANAWSDGEGDGSVGLRAL